MAKVHIISYNSKLYYIKQEKHKKEEKVVAK